MNNHVTYESCPICSSEIQHWKTKNTESGSFSISKCGKCRYAFTNPRYSLEYTMKFYSCDEHRDPPDAMQPKDYDSVVESEKIYPNSTLDAARMIGTIDALLQDNGQRTRKLLDVGCGYGFFSKKALELGFHVTSLETAANEMKIATQMIGQRPQAVSFEDLADPPASYDAILMSQILEHAHDACDWIAKASRLLKPNGVLAVALPNFDSFTRRLLQERDPYISPPAHLNYFNYHNLSLLLESHGLLIQKTSWVSRLSRSTFERRFAFLGCIGVHGIHTLSKGLLKIIDMLRLGMMLNIYAAKTRPDSVERDAC